MEELYFCMHLTENEHDINAHWLTKTCHKYDCQLMYYRKLKDGHVPMYREIKIAGPRDKIRRLKGHIRSNYMDWGWDIADHVERNPHKYDPPAA